jgi:hypothetical protein
MESIFLGNQQPDFEMDGFGSRRVASLGVNCKVSVRSENASSQEAEKGRLRFARKNDDENQYKPNMATIGMTQSVTVDFAFILYIREIKRGAVVVES